MSEVIVCITVYKALEFFTKILCFPRFVYYYHNALVLRNV